MLNITISLIEQFFRFFGIGFINTALSFAVLNSLMATTGLFTGTAVGIFSVIAFCVAVLHSYFWNKYWAFNSQNNGSGSSSFVKNIWQFGVAALLGLVVFVAVVYGAKKTYSFGYFLLMIAILIAGEALMWKLFRLSQNLKLASKQSSQEFTYFIVISAIGALINYGVLKYGTVSIPPKFGLGQQFWTNVIQIFATGISLVWNFIGYKIFVFKGE